MKQVLLSDVCEINPRIDTGISDDAECSFVPMEYVDEVSGAIANTSIRRVGDVKKGYTFFKNDDVIFAKITPCMENGKCAIGKNLRNGIAFGSTEYHVVRAKGEIIPEWIYHFLRQEKVRQQATGWFRGTAGQQRVPATFLEELKIPLPPLTEQKRIASLLARADRLRQLRRTAHDLSASVLQSVFLEMFGDPKTNSKKWDVESLEDVLASSPQNGLYVPEEQYESRDSENGVEMVHMSDAFYGRVERGSLKRVKISESDIRKYSITYNDILIARRSLNFEGAAKPCLIPVSDKPLVFESSMIRVTTDQSKILPIYLYYYFSNEKAKQAHILKYVTKSTISGINQDNLKQIEVIMPPLSLPRRVCERGEAGRGSVGEDVRGGEAGGWVV
jgi:type I restriction enzyme S subunit